MSEAVSAGLPDWLFLTINLAFLEAVGVKKLLGFLAFSFQYLAFLGGSWHIYYQSGVLAF